MRSVKRAAADRVSLSGAQSFLDGIAALWRTDDRLAATLWVVILMKHTLETGELPWLQMLRDVC